MVLKYFKENNGMLKLIGLFALLFIINKLIYGEREQEEPIARQRPRGNTGRRGNNGGGGPTGPYDPTLYPSSPTGPVAPYEPIAGQYHVSYSNPAIDVEYIPDSANPIQEIHVD